MKNKTVTVFFLAGFAFLLLYVVFAVRTVPVGLSIIPDWTISVADAAAESVPDKNPIPFKVHGLYGYVSQTGKVLLKKPYTYKTALSAVYCADYQESSSEIDVFDPAGQEVLSIKSAGFPFFQQNRLYMFLPGGNAVAEYTDGGRKWLYENYVPITAFNSSPNGAVIGFADGNLTGLHADGSRRFSFYPGGSAYEVIYGADISSSGNLAAAVCGLQEQRFLLTRFANGQNKIVFHEYLQGAVTGQTLVQFSKDEQTVYFNDALGLGVLDCKKLALRHIPLAGKILSVEEMSENLLAVLAADGQTYRVSIVENSQYLLGSFEFPAQSAYALHHDDALYISRDDVISRILFTRR